jgi:hypothetical protein
MPETPILVVSCDRYADLWKPFFEIFHLRWPDCPFPMYLGTNHATYDDPRVTTIHVGEDRDWSTNVRTMLDALGSEHVIFFLEDFLLLHDVDSRAIEALVDVARNERLGCLRLVGEMPLAFDPTRPVPGYANLGELAPRQINRVTAQVAIWNVETLRNLLIPGANAWEFEIVGSALSRRFPDRFWGVYKSPIWYEQSVEKGKWKPAGLQLCADAGVSVDLSARGVFTEAELHEHLNRWVRIAPAYFHLAEGTASFEDGGRVNGLRRMLRGIAESPRRLELWAATAAGLASPRLLTTLLDKRLDRRIASIRARVAETA